MTQEPVNDYALVPARSDLACVSAAVKTDQTETAAGYYQQTVFD